MNKYNFAGYVFFSVDAYGTFYPHILWFLTVFMYSGPLYVIIISSLDGKRILPKRIWF